MRTVYASPNYMPALQPASYYYAASPVTSATSTTVGVGTLRVGPVLLHHPAHLVRLVADIATAGEAGSKFRMGIYDDTGSGYPGTLIASGVVAADVSNSVPEVEIDASLEAGVYWFGGAVQNVVTTQPTMRVVANWTPPLLGYAGSTRPSSGSAFPGILTAGVTAELPATFPGGSGASGSLARLMFRTA